MTATPGAAEVRAPVVHVEHIISHSTAANVGVAEKPPPQVGYRL